LVHNSPDQVFPEQRSVEFCSLLSLQLPASCNPSRPPPFSPQKDPFTLLYVRTFLPAELASHWAETMFYLLSPSVAFRRVWPCFFQSFVSLCFFRPFFLLIPFFSVFGCFSKADPGPFFCTSFREALLGRNLILPVRRRDLDFLTPV